MLLITRICSLVFLVSAALLCSGCDRSKSASPVAPFPFTPPKIAGVYITDVMGNQLGVWGGPSGRRGYPNPTTGSVTIYVDFPRASDWRISIVRALGPGEDVENLEDAGGASVVSPDGLPVAVYVGHFEAGVMAFEWNGRTSAGQRVQSGFYRMYVQMREFTTWADVVVARTQADIAPGLLETAIKAGWSLQP